MINILEDEKYDYRRIFKALHEAVMPSTKKFDSTTVFDAVLLHMKEHPEEKKGCDLCEAIFKVEDHMSSALAVMQSFTLMALGSAGWGFKNVDEVKQNVAALKVFKEDLNLTIDRALRWGETTIEASKDLKALIKSVAKVEARHAETMSWIEEEEKK